MAAKDGTDRINSFSIPEITPEEAWMAARNLAASATRFEDPCGLVTVLNALSIKEKAREHNDFLKEKS